MERVLRESDGLGFCRSSLAGRRLNPTPENPFQYKQREREREREHERDERESCEPCDDDNVSVSTDNSCASNLSFETMQQKRQDGHQQSRTAREAGAALLPIRQRQLTAAATR